MVSKKSSPYARACSSTVCWRERSSGERGRGMGDSVVCAQGGVQGAWCRVHGPVAPCTLHLASLPLPEELLDAPQDRVAVGDLREHQVFGLDVRGEGAVEGAAPRA